MALLGSGVLAIWNGMLAGAEADFLAWHMREHIPERVGVPGFLRGRRYVAAEGHPAYFNFYEAETPAIFASAAYQARLNDPTPWTKRVVAGFTDTSRTPCEVVASAGRGEGGWIETIRLEAATSAGFAAAAGGDWLRALCGAPGIVAAHFLRGETDGRNQTAEAKLRDHPDHRAAWILLVEAAGAEPLRALRTGPLGDAALRAAGAAIGDRGLYALQFSLARADLAAAAPAA